jgi:hypothetical protein
VRWICLTPPNRWAEILSSVYARAMQPVCSVCGAIPFAWYQGPDFSEAASSPAEIRSEEVWLACAACAVLVEAGDREALVLRSAQDTQSALREQFEEGFWNLRDRA